jgi:hypothetical protein
LRVGSQKRAAKGEADDKNPFSQTTVFEKESKKPRLCHFERGLFSQNSLSIPFYQFIGYQ